jgi:hypothetical protein
MTAPAIARCFTATCPNLACAKPVTIALGADRGSCKWCGNEWPLRKAKLKLVKRGGQ